MRPNRVDYFEYQPNMKSLVYNCGGQNLEYLFSPELGVSNISMEDKTQNIFKFQIHENSTSIMEDMWKK